MNFLNQIEARLAALFRKRELDAEMDEELRSHIELRTQANIETGMNPEEARFAALRQFGWTESIKEDCREQRGVTWLETLAQDIRYGARQLRKNPGFTAVAALTLALGIGANTAIFSVINAVMLRPLPFPNSEGLVWIEQASKQDHHEPWGGHYLAWKEHTQTLQDLAAYDGTSMTLTGAGEAERIRVGKASATFFPMLGVQPLPPGRNFSASEDRPGASQVALLSQKLWRQRFGADPNVVGRAIVLDDASYTVVGVLPDTFRFFQQFDVWTPLALDSQQELTGSITTTGRVLPAMPRSASQTSPCRGCTAANDVQDFLLDLPARQDVGPLLFLSLPLEELQIVPQFSQHLLRLLPDFFDQSLLCDHDKNVSGPWPNDKLCLLCLPRGRSPNRSSIANRKSKIANP